MKSLFLAFWAALFLASVVFADSSNEARLAFGREVDRTKSLTESCVPTSEHLEKGELHAVTFAGYREPETELTVKIEKNRGAVHLFLYSHLDVLWRLSVEEGSSVKTVYTVGPNPTAVLDLPDETMAFSMGYSSTDQPQRICRPEAEAANNVATAAYHYSWAPSRHSRLEKAIEEYSNQVFASLVLIEPDETIGLVSRNSIRKTRRLQRSGQAILRHARLPGEAYASRDAVRLPQGLSSSEIYDWLVENGAAEPGQDDLLEFICLREDASYWAVGMDVSSFEPGCAAAESWDARRHLILTSSVELGGNYTCNGSANVVIHVPAPLQIKGRFINCAVQPWVYSE